MKIVHILESLVEEGSQCWWRWGFPVCFGLQDYPDSGFLLGRRDRGAVNAQHRAMAMFCGFCKQLCHLGGVGLCVWVLCVCVSLCGMIGNVSVCVPSGGISHVLSTIRGSNFPPNVITTAHFTYSTALLPHHSWTWGFVGSSLSLWRWYREGWPKLLTT